MNTNPVTATAALDHIDALDALLDRGPLDAIYEDALEAEQDAYEDAMDNFDGPNPCEGDDWDLDGEVEWESPY